MQPHVAILGAGPVGLEAALAAAERGWTHTVYETSPEVAGHVRAWGHVRLFTPWDLNVSDRMRAALGERAPSGSELPTGRELASALLDPVAEQLAGTIRTSTTVLAVGREGVLKHELIGVPERADRPFRILLCDAGGRESVEHADVVIDATGTYGNPNSLGDAGIPAPGESAHEARITRRLPDFAQEAGEWAGRSILLTGGGHSAQTAARALAELARDAPDTRVVWAIRSPGPTWFAAEGDDPLPERASLVTSSHELAGGASDAVDVRPGRVTEALRGAEGDRVAVALRNGTVEEVVADRVLALNGGVGDFTLYRQLQVHECYATAGPINLSAALLGGGDCLQQGTPGPDVLANPEPGFFLLGAKSYGRNSQFLLRNGYQQVSDVMELLGR